MFAVDLLRSDLSGSTDAGIAALVFILGFAIAAGFKATMQGRGLQGFIFAAFGADIAIL